MTEDEAKTKKCCGSLQTAHAIMGSAASMSNVLAPEWVNGNCIASTCMAWRWHPQLWEFSGQFGPYSEAKDTNGYGARGTKLPHEGHCGLAGPPER